MSSHGNHLRRADAARPDPNSLAGPGEPPYDGSIVTRVERLEQFEMEARAESRLIGQRLGNIETRLDQTATIADLHREIAAQTWRLVTFVCGFGTALVAATFFIARHTV